MMTTLPTQAARRLAQALAASAVALLAAVASPALAQQAAPARSAGTGFVNPNAGMPKTPPPDVAPIWKAPSLDMLAMVRQRGQLRVCVVPVEPMVMRDARGEFVGFSVDVARKLAQDLGVEPEFVPTTWPELLPDLLSRQCDLAATGLWVTLQRALVANFTDPTAVEGVYLFGSQALAPGRSALEDFNQPGVKLAVFPGSAQEALARRRFPSAQVVALDEPLQAVAAGRAHAALVSSLAPQVVVSAAAGRLYLPSATALDTQPVALAIRKGDADFLHLLNTWLRIQSASGWLSERSQHWAGTEEWAK